jgi:aryl-alcohol dehydrogenase-like predicted oxidoreductase
MKYNLLGKSSLKISEIGFGCMSLGDDENENVLILQKAVESGINFFDTADIYTNGHNEITVGKALKHTRENVIIATKAGNVIREDGKGLDWNASKKHILSAAEQSLKRLQTDYIDLYQLHGGTIDDPIDETIEAFETLKKQGKIRFYGISSIRPNVIREYIKRSSIVSVMMQYSLLDRRPEETCFSLLLDNGIGVLARGGLSKGLLAGKTPASFLNYNEEQVAKAGAAVSEISEASREPAQTALKFVLKAKPVSSAIVGIRTAEQLQQAVSSSDAPELSNEECEKLKSVLAPDLYSQHR